MKFKFVTEEYRRDLVGKIAAGQDGVYFAGFNGRRFVVEDEVLCLIEGKDEVLGSSGSLAPLNVDESRRIIAIIEHHTQGGKEETIVSPS